MKVTVDKDLCAGHGQCWAASPDLFPLNDDGYVDIETIEVPSEKEDEAVRGVNACPERALTIETN